MLGTKCVIILMTVIESIQANLSYPYKKECLNAPFKFYDFIIYQCNTKHSSKTDYEIVKDYKHISLVDTRILLFLQYFHHNTKEAGL